MSDERATRAGDLSSRIAALAEPVAAGDDVELVDVQVRGSRGSRVVRIVADAEGGLDVDRIAALSRAIGERLDERDLVDGSYTLEVSSPGLGRPLLELADFGRNIGREVRVLRNQARPEGEPGEVVGTVREVGDTGVVLEIDGDRTRLAAEEIEHGKVVLPW